MAVGFEKATGTKVAVIQKATGEMLAQVKAERANPKGDVWWAGPGRLATCRRPRRACSRPTGRRTSAQLLRLGAAHHRRVEEPVTGVYGGILALGYNTELVRQAEAAGAQVLEGPAQPGATRTR